MSIVERTAEFLGKIDRPNSMSPAPGELDPIERAVSEITARSELNSVREPEGKGVAFEVKAAARPARPTSSTSRIIRVDRNQLRRQAMITPDGERTPNAESLRRIKRLILAKAAKPRAGAPANLVMVASALEGEGKTFCAINLAISIASEVDRSVLLVDGDVANPSIPQALGLKTEQGLMDVLSRKVDLAEVLLNIDLGKFTLLPAGTAHQHAPELLASDAMRVLLQDMAERYHDRIIIFDSPPLLRASEAGILASLMGQIVLVVEAGKTSEVALKAALSHIESSNVTGLVLNKAVGPGSEFQYGGYG